MNTSNLTTVQLNNHIALEILIDPAETFQRLNNKIAAMGVILVDKSHQPETTA